MPLRRKTEPARGGERERAWIARQLADDKGKLAAAQPLFQREQRILGGLGRDMDQAVTQRQWQAGAIGAAGQAQRGRVLHPQPRALGRRRAERIGGAALHPVERQPQRQRRSRPFPRRGEHLAVAEAGLGQAGAPFGGAGVNGAVESSLGNRIHVLLMF